MPLKLIEPIDYTGYNGVIQLRDLQVALSKALNTEDWSLVQQLDRICMVVIDKVIAANKDDLSALINALDELKGVYANLIMQCKCDMTSMAS
jgi:flagellar protein FliT